MEQNSEGQDQQQHIINIWEVNKDHVASMKAKISTMPRLLTISAGQSSCCIFRVAHSQVQLDRYAYHPHVVSVGPYHYKEQSLEMIQEHKWRFLASLLSRTMGKGLWLEDYLKAIKGLEDRARGCYSEVIDLHSDEFVEMMVLDGCFIIEFFRILCGVVQTVEDNPIFSLSWVRPFLLRDFIKLENQIPFFILQGLFDLSKMPEEESCPGPSPSLVTLALTSFGNVMGMPQEIIERCQNLDVKHLHDLLRSSFIPENLSVTTRNLNSSIPYTHFIFCITKLRRYGINFKVGNSDTFLDVKFQDGVIEMPSVTIDDFTSPFFLNCVAFEQSYKHCSQHITTYATLMDCLINTYNDVEFLCDLGIIDNYFGTNEDVSRLFHIMGKDVSLDLRTCYLADLFDDVNEFFMYSWHAQWGGLKYSYFSTRWSFISALAAVILLVLTVAQTFYTIYAYYR